MAHWTLTVREATTAVDVIGIAPTPDMAVRKMVIAAGSLLERGGDNHPRYELCVDRQTVAVVQVGDDDAGRPDHRGAARLLDELLRPVSPYGGFAL